jgi:GTP-binding protein HflX
VSHPQFEDHLKVVEETLSSIGAGAQRTMLLFNKIDQLSDPEGEVDRPLLIEGLRQRFADHDGPVLFLSAKTKEGMDSLREVLYAEVRELHVQRFPHNHFLY